MIVASVCRRLLSPALGACASGSLVQARQEHWFGTAQRREVSIPVAVKLLLLAWVTGSTDLRIADGRSRLCWKGKRLCFGR